MGLSCDYDSDFEPGTTAWNWPSALKPLATKRSRKCCSCGKPLAPGDLAAEWRRYKVPEYDVEISIWGDSGELGPPRASKYHCVECDLISGFLRTFDYVFNPADDMRNLAKEHAGLVAAGGKGCR